MIKKEIIVIVFILFLLIIAVYLISSISALDWPMFMNNLNHTGYQNETIGPSFFKLWNYSSGATIQSSEIVSNGIVYVGDSEGDFNAINATNGSQIWVTVASNGFSSSSPAISNGIVYSGCLDNRIYAFNATNGSQIWSYLTGGQIYSSPAISNGVVYIGSNDNNLYAFNATNGSKIWNYTTGSPIYSSPAISNGIVYFGSYDNQTYALNATNGSKIWNYTTLAPMYLSSPAISNGIVYIGGTDNRTYALNATNGSQIWNYTTNNTLSGSSSPAIYNGIVYIGSNDNNLYAFNATNGSKIWNYTTGSPIYSSPAISNGIVYIGSQDKNLYALNSTNGNKIWNYTLPNSITSSSPAISNGIIYISDNTNYLYALASNALPIITLNSPSNGNTSSASSVNFNATASDDWGLANISLILNGVISQTNSTGLNNSNYLFAATLATGSYTWAYQACDIYGTCTNSSIRSLTVSVSSGGNGDVTAGRISGGSSSGYAGGSTYAPATSQQYSWYLTLSPQTISVLNFSNPLLGFNSSLSLNEMDISVNGTQNTEVIITQFFTTPLGIPPPDSNQIYQYLQISFNNPAQILPILQNANLIFKVNKSWISENNKDPSNITIYKLDNSTNNRWVALPTTLNRTEDNFYYYQTSVNSFSYFAIGGNSVNTTEQQTTSNNASEQTNSNKSRVNITGFFPLNYLLKNILNITENFIGIKPNLRSIIYYSIILIIVSAIIIILIEMIFRRARKNARDIKRRDDEEVFNSSSKPDPFYDLFIS